MDTSTCARRAPTSAKPARTAWWERSRGPCSTDGGFLPLFAARTSLCPSRRRGQTSQEEALRARNAHETASFTNLQTAPKGPPAPLFLFGYANDGKLIARRSKQSCNCCMQKISIRQVTQLEREIFLRERCSKERDSRKRDILQRDILQRDILQRDILESIIEKSIPSALEAKHIFLEQVQARNLAALEAKKKNLPKQFMKSLSGSSVQCIRSGYPCK